MNTLIIILLIIIIIIVLYEFNIYIIKNKETFSSSPSKVVMLPENINYLSQQISTDEADKIITLNDDLIGEIQNPNYDTLNNMPYLINDEGTGYYQKKIKIETNPNSPLLALNNYNNKILNDNISYCKKKKDENKNENNQTTNIKGYNNYVNLRNENNSPVSGIGRSLLTQYDGLPLPS